MTEEFQGKLEDLEGLPFYVVNNRAPIITKYPIKRTHEASETQLGVILYEVLPLTVNSYTVGARSGEIGSKFHTIGAKAVLTLFKNHENLSIDDIYDAKTRKLVLDVIEENPEFFI